MLTVALAMACSLEPEGVGFGSGDPAGSATKADAIDDAGTETEGEDADETEGGGETGEEGDDAECGNGVREADEQCDDADFGGQACEDFGFDDGMLSCTASCTIDTAWCHTCGDGMKQDAELCDGSDLGGETCMSLGHGAGDLACGADCQSFDESACGLCGNGTIDPGEQCDGTDLGGQTCQSQGFDQGQLGCTASCTFNTAGCSNDNPTCGAAGDLCLTDADCCSGLCGLVICF